MISITQDHLRIISNIPSKFDGNELFSSKPQLTFYEKMICDYTFYIFKEIEEESFLLKDILQNLAQKNIKLATFSFNFYQEKEYITICHEKHCYLLEIKENLKNLYLHDILIELTKNEIHFISPNFTDYQRFRTIIDEMNEKDEIKTSNFIFPKEQQEQISYEFQQIVQKVEKKTLKMPIFYLTKDSILTFMIRRFYFKRKYFENSSFFDIKSNEIHEFKKADFIEIRQITLNVFTVLYKKTNQIFVQKIYQNLPSIDEFQQTIEIYEKINKIHKFVHCFGFTKTCSNKIESLIFAFKSGGNLQEFIYKKRKEKKKELTNIIDYKLKISFEIIEGIYYLHLNNIIHRDLKPDNILIDQEKNFFIGDFDCSKIIYDNKTMTMTTDVGQVQYQSPEMRYSEMYSKSTDIYSYGLILYFIFAEEHPFQDLLNTDIYHMKDDKYLINMISKNINDEFIKNISSKCLKFSKEERLTPDEILDLFIEHFIRKFTENKYKLLLYLLKINDSIINEKILSIYNKKFLIHGKKELNQSNILLIIIRLLSLNHQNHGDIKNKDNYQIINFLTKLSNDNNSTAQFVLAKIYRKDYIIPSDINKSIHYYTLSANNNNSYAQHYLGVFYYNNGFVKQNINKSIHYLTLSANQNNSDSQFYLGYIYYSGNFVSRDINKSIYYLTLSSNQNNSDSQYILGHIYMSELLGKQDINKSIHYFTLSADNNNPEAQRILGILYYKGAFVEQNINKSIHYLTLSANQNNSDSQYFLGYIYYSGEFVSCDINKSIYYLTLSSNQNNSDSQYFLGQIYLEGKSVPFDFNKAFYYYSLSANQNNSDSQYKLGLFYYEGMFIPRDVKKAIYYLTLSSNQNNPDSQLFLGCIYYASENLSHDIHKAIFYLTLAANQNNCNAQFFLGFIYFKGEYIQRNIDKSIYYFTLAANQNNPDSQYYLGFIYYDGKFVPRDINKSIYYFTLSANQNNPISQYFLGFIYYEGKYITRDIAKSIYYLKLSANQNNPNSQYFLGCIYYGGRYITRNLAKSFNYFKLSATKNHSESLFILGNMYYQGIHVSKDINKAIQYFKISANLNNVNSQLFLATILLIDESVPQNVNLAIYYLKCSSKQYSKLGNLYLGMIYFTNLFTQRDIKKSIYYFKEASSFNDSLAKNNLGIIYKNGYEVDKNILLAKVYFEEAIHTKSDNYSLYNLARIFYFGDYLEIKKDVIKAIQLLEMASNQNFLPADIFLLMIYSSGNKDLINQEKANKYSQNIKESEFNNVLPIFDLGQDQKDRVFDFIKNFDFFYNLGFYSEKKFFNHLFHIIYDENYVVYDCIKENEYDIKDIKNQRICKDLTDSFYEGFGSDI